MQDNVLKYGKDSSIKNEEIVYKLLFINRYTVSLYFAQYIYTTILDLDVGSEWPFIIVLVADI